MKEEKVQVEIIDDYNDREEDILLSLDQLRLLYLLQEKEFFDDGIHFNVLGGIKNFKEI